MDWLNSLIDSVNAFAWGPPMLGMLGVTGVLLTLGLVFMPWRKVGYAFRLLYDKDGPLGDGRHREHCRRRDGSRSRHA